MHGSTRIQAVKLGAIAVLVATALPTLLKLALVTPPLLANAA